MLVLSSWSGPCSALLVLAGEPAGPPMPAEPAEPAEARIATPANRPRHALVYENMLVGGFAPARLDDRLQLGYRWRPRGTGPLFEDAHLSAYANVHLSPALLVVGPMIDLAPITPLRLRASYAFAQYFGVFQYPQSYTTPHADHSPGQLREGRRAGAPYPARGGRLELSVRLQAGLPLRKPWRIVLRNEATMLYQHFALQGDDDVIYDIAIDALVPGRGFGVLDDADLLYVHDFVQGRRLSAGGRATVTKIFYPAGVYEPGEERDDPNGPMVRVGPLLAFRFFDRPDRRFDQPTVFVLAQWHILHRWRTGRVEVPDGSGGTVTRGVSQAVPTVLFGLIFSGDLVGD